MRNNRGNRNNRANRVNRVNRVNQNNQNNQNPHHPRPELDPNHEDKEIFELFSDIEVLSKQEILINQLKESPFYEEEEFDPYHIHCKICVTKMTDYHHLPCKHGFCVPCLSLLFLNHVDSSIVLPEDITCPECSTTIPENIVNKFTSYETYQKIISLRYKIKFQLLVAQDKAVTCPVPDCIGYAHIIPGEKITACNKCKCSLCCLCKSAVHPGITCEESRLNGKDAALEELILSQNWKKCPTCGVPVEKIDGCQFLYCDSLICKGRNNMCYICGRFVIEAQHFSHYQTKGPFGDTCNTLDGIPEDIDPALLVPIIPGNVVEEINAGDALI